jgi:hypothetical protein
VVEVLEALGRAGVMELDAHGVCEEKRGETMRDSWCHLFFWSEAVCALCLLRTQEGRRRFYYCLSSIPLPRNSVAPFPASSSLLSFLSFIERQMVMIRDFFSFLKKC